jgi:hypothetical protein
MTAVTFKVIPLSNYTLSTVMLPLLETFMKLFFKIATSAAITLL